MGKIKRISVPTRKLKESLELEQLEKRSKLNNEIWCTVELNSTHKEYIVSSKALETEVGGPVTEKDIYIDSNVIWKTRGTPYAVTILETHRKRPKPISRHVCITDSSDEDTDDLPPRKSKKVKDTNESNIPVPSTEKDQAIVSNKEKPMAMPQSPYTNEFEVPFSENGIFSPHDASTTACTSTSSQDEKDTCISIDDKLDAIQKQLEIVDEKLESIIKFLPSKSRGASIQDDDEQKKFTTESGVNLLTIKAVDDPCKYGLALMDILFTEEEMASCTYSESGRTKKPGLPQEKIKLLEDCRYTTKKYNQYASQIKKKCAQKCLDKARKLMKAEPEEQV